jgi:hypothetical protein
VTKKQYYHTQEARKEVLTSPIKCIRHDAWLGDAFYFWLDLEDAEAWGNKSKRNTGVYEIYKTEINTENILDTVFNEDHYMFWYAQIVKVAKKIMAKTRKKPTLKELNDYLKERGAWDEVDGINFQDLPVSPENLIVQPIKLRNGKMLYFPYRKRIQLAVYNSKIILTFALLKKERCV